jgi:hypothetical protein
MANKTITNEKRAVFINTASSSSSSDVYSRLGEGINTFTPSNNGTISTKHYINDKFATSRRNGLQKQWAFSGDRVIDNVANDYLVSLTEKTGSDVETTLIIADLIDPVGTSKNAYKAKRYEVMVDVTNDGSIEGGQDVAIDGTIYANGDPEDGYITISGETATWSDTTPA